MLEGKNKRGKYEEKRLNSHILYREERDNCGIAVISSEGNERSNAAETDD